MVFIKKIFGFYFKTDLLVRILLGLVLGAVCGLILKDVEILVSVLQILGDIFVRALKMIVQPVILFTIIVGAGSIAPSKLAKVGVKVLLWYLITSILSTIVGLLVGNIFDPGKGLNLVGTSAKAIELNAPPLSNTLLSIIPTNPFYAFANGEVLPTIFFALIFGIGVAFCRDNDNKRISEAAEVVYKFFEGASEVMFKVVGWVMQYAPIGVFALIFLVFATQGAEAFGSLFKVTASTYVGFIILIFTVYLIMLLSSKLKFFDFFNKIKSPAITAFVTRSSGGTLPVSMEVAEKKLGISRGVYGFSLPLGATINMNGTTIYLAVCTLFIASAIGQPLSIAQQIPIIITALLGAIGTAAVPGAGAIMLLLVLNSVGLEVEAGSATAAAYAIILGIDALLDMGRTSLNVIGDLIVTAVVAKSENEMDMNVYNKKI